MGGTTTLDFFLKAYKFIETKGWFDYPDKLDFLELLPYEAFSSKPTNENLLDKDITD